MSISTLAEFNEIYEQRVDAARKAHPGGRIFIIDMCDLPDPKTLYAPPETTYRRAAAPAVAEEVEETAAEQAICTDCEQPFERENKPGRPATRCMPCLTKKKQHAEALGDTITLHCTKCDKDYTLPRTRGVHLRKVCLACSPKASPDEIVRRHCATCGTAFEAPIAEKRKHCAEHL